MESKETCPMFGNGWSEKLKECKACTIVNVEYAEKCKEETIKKDESKNEKHKKSKYIKKKDGNNQDLCRKLMKDGVAEEDIIRDLAKIYTNKGKDEKYAKMRAKNIIYLIKTGKR